MSSSPLRWLCLLMIFQVWTPASESLEKLCGKPLNDALDLICTNGFATKTKKSIQPSEFAALEFDLSSALERLPFLSRSAANVLAKTRRRRHGVVDECCKKACTIQELSSYCL